MPCITIPALIYSNLDENNKKFSNNLFMHSLDRWNGRSNNLDDPSGKTYVQ